MVAQEKCCNHRALNLLALFSKDFNKRIKVQLNKVKVLALK
jgi:hypothetical protein